MRSVNELNVLALAYIGDSIYEIYIRNYLIEQGLVKVNELQKVAVKYVSAKGQASYLKDLIDKGFLTDEEINIVKRARNHKGNRHPKNTDIRTYKDSTGFEALIGYLYLTKNNNRIIEIMKEILGRELCIFMEEM